MEMYIATVIVSALFENHQSLNVRFTTEKNGHCLVHYTEGQVSTVVIDIDL